MNYENALRLFLKSNKILKSKQCRKNVEPNSFLLNTYSKSLIKSVRYKPLDAKNSQVKIQDTASNDQIVQKIPITTLLSKKQKTKQKLSHIDLFAATKRHQFEVTKKHLVVLQECFEDIKIKIVKNGHNIINYIIVRPLKSSYRDITNNLNQFRHLFTNYMTTILNQKALPTNQEAGFGGSVVMSSDENFESLIESQTPTFVMFYASWCGHCTTSKPPYSKLATSWKGKVNVVAIDAAENPKTADFANITVLPYFKLYRSGVEMRVFEGPRTFEDMTEFLKTHSGVS